MKIPIETALYVSAALGAVAMLLITLVVILCIYASLIRELKEASDLIREQRRDELRLRREAAAPQSAAEE